MPGQSASESLSSTWKAHATRWQQIRPLSSEQSLVDCPDADGDGYKSAKHCGDVLDGANADCDDNDPKITPLNERYISSGLVMIGSESEHAGADEQPAHLVMLTGYCLDVNEVSTQSWVSWLKQSARAPAGKDVRNLSNTGEIEPGKEEHPAEGVTWKEANDYCAARNQSLPTEAQWEKAARGGCERGTSEYCEETELLPYPWGSTAPTCSLSNHQLSTSFPPTLCHSDTVKTTADAQVGPYGHRHLAGNVWEFVADVWHPETYASRAKNSGSQLILNPKGPAPQADSFHVLKGGGWNTFSTNMRAANRFHDLVLGSATGFRCARSFTKQSFEDIPQLQQSTVSGTITSRSTLQGRALYVSAFDSRDADSQGRMAPGRSPMAELRLTPNGQKQQKFSMALPHGSYIISAALDGGSGAQKKDYVAASGSGGFGHANENPVRVAEDVSSITISLRPPPQHRPAGQNQQKH